ncbi:MAG TPA: GTPase [Methanospirillum sp.]|nr:GTPase [Methanospirillum sp.]
MNFEKIPTVPTADEVLDRALRRAATKMREKKNKKRASEEFVQAAYLSVHDKLVSILQGFPEMVNLPPFYQDLFEVVWGVDRLKKALGAVGWAARWSKDHRGGLMKDVRYAKEDDATSARRKAIARLASVVHQIDDQLLYLNEVRNVMRKLPVIEDVFTVVVAGYPNVGKSSFIRRVSSAEPEIASYPFTTKGVIIGHRYMKREKIQLIDTPGVLDRPTEERNPIEMQAITAIINVGDVILYILDPSAYCGYPLEDQMKLLEEVKSLVTVPVIVVVNKSDVKTLDGYQSMCTASGEGVDEVLNLLLAEKPAYGAAHHPGRQGFSETDEDPADQETYDRPSIKWGEPGMRPAGRY